MCILELTGETIQRLSLACAEAILTDFRGTPEAAEANTGEGTFGVKDCGVTLFAPRKPKRAGADSGDRHSPRAAAAGEGSEAWIPRNPMQFPASRSVVLRRRQPKHHALSVRYRGDVACAPAREEATRMDVNLIPRLVVLGIALAVIGLGAIMTYFGYYLAAPEEKKQHRARYIRLYGFILVVLGWVCLI